MAPAFSKEAILQGSIDHLCLVCESHLRSERDMCLHVATAEHRQNLDSTDYVEKYKNDRVRKVKSRYFCEFCNVIVLTRSSVKLHVDEPTHEQNKSFQSIARVDDVIVSRNITIREEAWHGFIDDKTCVICNVEYEDQDEHRTESTHVINLIQSKVTNDNNVYRMIDNSTFHCLTCNEIVAEITTHFEDEKHNKILQQCTRSTPSQQKKDKSPNEYYRAENKGEKSRIEDKGECYEKFEEYTTNTCNVTEHSNDLDSEIIKHHEENEMSTSVERNINKDSLPREGATSFNISVSNNSESANTVNLETRPTEREEEEHADRISGLRKAAEEYGLTYNATNNKIHCPICYKRVPSSSTNINEHVNGEHHKNKARLHNQSTISKRNDYLLSKKCKFLRVPSARFINEIQCVRIFNLQDIYVNEKYCINYYCFTFLTKINETHVRCQVCEVKMSNRDVEEHVKHRRHMRALMEVPVVIYDESEFIREIRSDIFQCGFCNIVDSWGGMENHLRSTLHLQKKIKARERSAKYPLIDFSDLMSIDMLSLAYSLHNSFK